MTKKILLVLDNSIVASDFKQMLEYGGYQVCGYANTLLHAFQLFLNTAPDLIIFDIASRPMQSSLDFVNSIKVIRHTPVVYLILDDDASIINEYIKPCLDAYIVKPVSRHQLITASKKLIALNKSFNQSAK